MTKFSLKPTLRLTDMYSTNGVPCIASLYGLTVFSEAI